MDEWFAPEARPRIRSMLSANRRLITEQGALQLLKRALLWCSDDETAEWRLSDLVISYFAISDGFAHVAGAEEAPSLDEHAQRSLAAEVFSNQWFNAPRDLVGSFARHSFRWADSPDVDVQPRQLYREATGVELSVVEDLALALWAIAMGGQVVVTIGALAESTGYSEADVEAALGLISADPDQLRALVEEHEGREGLEWSFSAFERYPLISDGDARVIYAPNLLIRRVFSWTSTFDVRAALGARATPFIQLMQQRSEAQVRAAFDGMFPDSPTQRVYRKPSRRVPTELRSERPRQQIWRSMMWSPG